MSTVYVVMFWVEGVGYDVTENKVFLDRTAALNYADEHVEIIGAVDYEIQHHTVS